MTPSLRIARIFGIEVRLHVTFLALIALLVGWSVMPGEGSRLIPMLALGSLFVLAGLHELGHALVAKRLDVEVQDILFLPILLMVRLRLPEDARTEMAVAGAGPAVNLVLAAGLLGLAPVLGVPPATLFQRSPESLFELVFWMNLLMGTVNLLPAFPMDGGRLFRAALATRLDYPTATRIAARVGWGVVLVAGTAGFILTRNVVILMAAAFLVYLGRREEQAANERARLREVDRMKRELEEVAPPDESGDEHPAVSKYGDFRRLEDPEFRENFERYRERIEELREED